MSIFQSVFCLVIPVAFQRLLTIAGVNLRQNSAVWLYPVNGCASPLSTIFLDKCLDWSDGRGVDVLSIVGQETGYAVDLLLSMAHELRFEVADFFFSLLFLDLLAINDSCNEEASHDIRWCFTEP